MKNFLYQINCFFQTTIGYIICNFLAFLPLYIMNTNLIVDLILMACMLFLPIIGMFLRFALWFIGLYFAIVGPQDIIAYVYYIFFAIFFFTNFIPFIFTFTYAYRENQHNELDNQHFEEW